MKNTSQIAIGIVMVLALAGSFFAGRAVGMQSSASGSAAVAGANGQNGGRGGQAAARRGGQFGGGAFGQILTKDDKGITLKLNNGGSSIVFFSATTTVSKSQPATITDLKEGDFVMVSGTPNTDGSITARSIRTGEMPPPAAGQRPAGSVPAAQ